MYVIFGAKMYINLDFITYYLLCTKYCFIGM